MKYMLLIHHGTTPVPGTDAVGGPLRRGEARRLRRLQGAQRDAGLHPRACGWHDPETATTVRVQDGRTLTTDGPFVDVKEALGGYCFFEADDLDAAIELASRIPAARMGGAVEVRPIVG